MMPPTVSTPARHDAAKAFATLHAVRRGGAYEAMVQAVEAHLNPAAVDIAAMDEATYTLYRTLAQLAPDEARTRLTMDQIAKYF